MHYNKSVKCIGGWWVVGIISRSGGGSGGETILLQRKGVGMTGPEVAREEERGKDAKPSKMVRPAAHTMH